MRVQVPDPVIGAEKTVVFTPLEPTIYCFCLSTVQVPNVQVPALEISPITGSVVPELY